MKNNIYRKNSLGINEYLYDIFDYAYYNYYIVVGYPIINPYQLYDVPSGYYFYYTKDRFIPKILKDLEIVKSTGEVKKTRPDLFINFPEDYLGFFSITLGDYMKTWSTPYITFLVGPENKEISRNIWLSCIEEE